VNIQDQLIKTPAYLFFFILSTVPIIFGAIHPVIFAFYTAIVLTCIGGWLCFFPPVSEMEKKPISRKWLIPILLVLLFSLLQAIPLPLAFLEIISPARATRVEMVNALAKTTQNYAPISEHGLLGLTSTIFLFALLIYFYGLKRVLNQNENNYRIVYLLIIIVGTFEALYGLFQFLNPRIGILWLPVTTGRAAYGTIIYKNQFASFMNMCWPLAIAAATVHLQSLMHISDNKKKKKSLKDRIRRMDEKTKQAPLFIFATGIMLLSVLFSLSRGGIIAMLLVMIFLNFFLPITRKIKIIFLGLFVLFVFAYGALLGLDNVISRFDSIGQSGATRLDTYMASIPMLLDHAWSGIGFGSYALLSPIYLKGLAGNIQWDHSHNEYLQLMIELGIPAAILIFLWLLGAMIFSGIKLHSLIRTQSQTIHPSVIIAGGAYCGLLGLMVHGIADFGWRLPANLFYAVTLAALVSYGLENRNSLADVENDT